MLFVGVAGVACSGSGRSSEDVGPTTLKLALYGGGPEVPVGGGKGRLVLGARLTFECQLPSRLRSYQIVVTARQLCSLGIELAPRLHKPPQRPNIPRGWRCFVDAQARDFGRCVRAADAAAIIWTRTPF